MGAEKKANNGNNCTLGIYKATHCFVMLSCRIYSLSPRFHADGNNNLYIQDKALIKG